MEGFLLVFGLLAIAGFAFWIWALVDCIRVPDDSMYQSGTKLVWVLVIVLLQVVGAIIYLAVGRPRNPAGSQPHRSVTAPPDGGMPPPPPPP
jgi:hypothetical protein